MRYRIEYADGRCCNFANSRKDLLDWLKLLKDEQIVPITLLNFLTTLKNSMLR
ncbi:hypothetical protein [Mediterraneibacter massiliensis]|jgi:hypothetical protein|uniref:hypothetical protein n=1 Tax=Mediterraneibacter massiliensis TaxID=1720300 RepID=UPI0022E53041|nr:hypothetical protein [Mediterraneibacter massiliensis]